MFKQKLLVLCIALISAVSLMFGNVVTVFGADSNVATTPSGSITTCTVTSTENIFNEGDYVSVAFNTNQGDIQNAYAFIYQKTDIYQRIISGFNVSIKNGEQNVELNNQADLTVTLATNLAGSYTTQVIRFDEDFNIEVFTATITDGVLNFTVDSLGEFWLLNNGASEVDALTVLERSRILTSNLQSIGGLVTSANYVKYLNFTAPGLIASQLIGADDSLLHSETISDLLSFSILASL